jgi:hypothetical protein
MSARVARSLPWIIAVASSLAYAVARAPLGTRAPAYIALHTGLALAQLALARALLDSNTDTRIQQRLLAASVFARVALVAVDPFTTTDVGRYLWDGAAALSGHDPYAHAPNAPALAALRERWPLPADHHDVVGCYPPLAELLFALCALGGPSLSLWLWKLSLAVVSALSARSLARACETPAQWAAATLWLLHPLVLFEGGVGAHLDVLTGAALIWALLAIERDRWGRAGLWLGVAVSLKLTPLIVCVALWPRARSRWRFLLACALLPLLTIALPWALGLALPGSLPLVATHWNFGAPLWTALYTRWPTSDAVIRPALSALGALWVLAQWLRPRASHSAIARDALLGYAVTNPTLYPWYVLPSLACAARAPSAFAWGLATVTPFTYEVIDRYALRREWTPARWPLWLTAIVPVALALAAWAHRRRQRA